MKKINFEAIAEKILPFVNVFAQHNWVRAISNGFMNVIPFTLIAAIFTILATPPVTAEVIAQGGFYGTLMSGWYHFAESYSHILLIPANMTTGLLSVIAVMGIAYTLAKIIKLKNEITATFTALIMFLIVAAPMSDGVLNARFLGSEGLFVAMIVAILSVEITSFCIRRNITIRFGDAVPEGVAAPFKAFIPVLINMVIFFGLSVLVNVTMGTTIPELIMGAIMPTISNVNSLWGMIAVFSISNLLWFFGVHGSALTMMLYIPLSFQLTAENAAIVAAGGTPIWHPIFISMGAAAWIGLNIAMLLVAKSQKLKAMGKLAIIPNLFNINEPIIFGSPVVFNIFLLIPVVIIPIIQMVAIYFIGEMGLLTGGYNILMVNLPFGMNSYFGTLSMSTALIIGGIQLLGTFVWIPFVKFYDNQCLKEEQAEMVSSNE